MIENKREGSWVGGHYTEACRVSVMGVNELVVEQSDPGAGLFMLSLFQTLH